jgi:hypothetical protein
VGSPVIPLGTLTLSTGLAQVLARRVYCFSRRPERPSASRGGGRGRACSLCLRGLSDLATTALNRSGRLREITPIFATASREGIRQLWPDVCAAPTRRGHRRGRFLSQVRQSSRGAGGPPSATSSKSRGVAACSLLPVNTGEHIFTLLSTGVHPDVAGRHRRRYAARSMGSRADGPNTERREDLSPDGVAASPREWKRTRLPDQERPPDYRSDSRYRLNSDAALTRSEARQEAVRARQQRRKAGKPAGKPLAGERGWKRPEQNNANPFGSASA